MTCLRKPRADGGLSARWRLRGLSPANWATSARRGSASRASTGATCWWSGRAKTSCPWGMRLKPVPIARASRAARGPPDRPSRADAEEL